MFFADLLFDFILKSLFHFFEWLFATLLTPLLDLFPGHVPRFGIKREKKRQARGLLKRGLMLLREGRIDEADLRFGTALKVNPQIVNSLSKRQRRNTMLELSRKGGGLNATYLWLQLEEREKAPNQQEPSLSPARGSGEKRH
jgi:hypothetical protein